MAPWWWPFGRVPEVSPLALVEEMTATAPQIIDVRSEIEYRGGHIPGAVSVPLPALGRRLDDLKLDPARPVVAICLTAHRSIPAVRLLTQRGYQARQLSGGMLAWRAAHLPETRSPAGQTE